MIKRSCEDPTILYVCLPGRRFIFREGRYCCNRDRCAAIYEYMEGQKNAEN